MINFNYRSSIYSYILAFIGDKLSLSHSITIFIISGLALAIYLLIEFTLYFYVIVGIYNSVHGNLEQTNIIKTYRYLIVPIPAIMIIDFLSAYCSLNYLGPDYSYLLTAIHIDEVPSFIVIILLSIIYYRHEIKINKFKRAIIAATIIIVIIILIDYHLLSHNLIIFKASLYCMIISIKQELYFRKIIYKTALGNNARFPSIMFSSLYFAIVHDINSWTDIVYLFIIGVLLALVYDKTNKLIYPIFIHFLLNMPIYINRLAEVFM